MALPKGQQGQGFPVQLLVVISQPGQQNPSYGPVIPQQFQTYQQNEYQVVGTEEYQQVQHQNIKGSGLKQTVEVVPENLPISQQVNQGTLSMPQRQSRSLLNGTKRTHFFFTVVRNHYADLYTQQHGQYPYTHTQYQVGQGQVQGQNVDQGIQGQWGVQGSWEQQGQGQQQWSQSQGHQGQPHSGVQHGVPNVDVQGTQQNTQGVQGLHGLQDVKNVVQGLQNLQGLHSLQGVRNVVGGIQSLIQGRYQTTYQGQSQQQQLGVGNIGSGQYHAGGFQGIFSQGQKIQDTSVSQYYQNKHISHIIGGAISLDGKPLGYPLDRPLSTSALSVPNVYVQTVYIHHKGQPTNEVNNQ